jgi:1,2-phenylacetyl-CoA epoxidase catalytic subunit
VALPVDLGEEWTMETTPFVRELEAFKAERLSRMVAAGQTSLGGGPVDAQRLLEVALANEISVSELAAAWTPSTPEIDVKLALARQAGDEAKHFRLIVERLGELGVDATRFDPGPRSPVHQFLQTLETTVERVAAGQFTREALALVRNDEFVRFCVARGDEQTAALYRDVIQPDERHHHELGRRLLARLVDSDADRQRARAAAQRTLELAEEVQEIARLKLGVSRAPGC